MVHAYQRPIPNPPLTFLDEYQSTLSDHPINSDRHNIPTKNNRIATDAV